MARQRDREVATTARWQTLLPLLVILLAMGLRFYRLDVQSFWNDEGNTARLVERPLSLIIEGAAGDIHPPGYYLLLHGWREWVGQTEFALRSYSAFCGVITVAIAIALGRQAGGRRSGWIAGLSVALHPLAVYYSQEARMYAQLGLATALTLSAASALAAAPHPRRPSLARRRTLALAACVALGLYTQYTYILALVGLNLAFAALWLTRRPWRWRTLARWSLAHALGGLLFLPWAPIALGAAGWQPPDLNQGDAITRLARTLVIGITPPQQAPTDMLMLAGGLLLLAGTITLMASRTQRHRLIGWGALGIAVVPAISIAAAGLYRPAYLKFLTMSLAPLAVIWSLPFGRRAHPTSRRGRAARWGRWALIAVALVSVATVGWAQINALTQLYHDPALARDDYRGIAAQIRALGRPGDAVLLNAPNQWEVFTYYYGTAPQDVLPVYPAPYRPTQEEATAWIAEVLEAHRGGRLFVLYWGDGESDPARYIETALAHAAFKAGERWVTTIRLADYGVGPAEPLPARPVGARLGAHITLSHYALPPNAPSPGTIVPLTLIWQADHALEERLKVFVHVVDAAGALVTQVDMEPQAGLAPTTIWQPGDRIVDRYGLALPVDLPPGAYTIRVGIYRASGERLAITIEDAPVGDALHLAEITVRPAE